jgi:hypothetical protein
MHLVVLGQLTYSRNSSTNAGARLNRHDAIKGPEVGPPFYPASLKAIRFSCNTFFRFVAQVPDNVSTVRGHQAILRYR